MSLLRRLLLPLLLALGTTLAAAPFVGPGAPGLAPAATSCLLMRPSSRGRRWPLRRGSSGKFTRAITYTAGAWPLLWRARRGRLDTSLPPGLAKDDPYFGPVEVFYNDFVTFSLEGPVPQDAMLRVSYQGCADAGLCLPGDPLIALAGAKAGTVTASGPAQPPSQSTAGLQCPPRLREALASRLAEGFSLGTLLIFFLAGIGLAFTPCVPPMVPILSSIIVGQGVQVMAETSGSR